MTCRKAADEQGWTHTELQSQRSLGNRTSKPWKRKKKATPQANISVSVSNYLAVFSPVCKKEASYATCFVPGFWGAFYAFITELTAKKWLEMRGFRDCGGHNEGSQQDSNHGCCSSWLAP